MNTNVLVENDSSKLLPAALPVVIYNMNTPVSGSVQPARPRRALDEPLDATLLADHVAVVEGNHEGRAHVPLGCCSSRFSAFAYKRAGTGTGRTQCESTLY